MDVSSARDAVRYIKSASRYARIIMDMGCASTAEAVKRAKGMIEKPSIVELLTLWILFEMSITANMLSTKEKLVGGVDMPNKSEYGLMDNNKTASA